MLIPVFRRRLLEELQLELACCDAGLDLDGMITLAISWDQHLRTKDCHPVTVSQAAACSRPGKEEDGAQSNAPQQSLTADPEPIQIGLSCLTAEERKRRREQGLCIYCGSSGHFLVACPILKQKVDIIPAPSLLHNQLFFFLWRCLSLIILCLCLL